ncbi:glutamine amidotransferase-related protein [Dapis sp. BLCC M172]|uniref:glutamine amidotransferase-related protein n=1 Tax=Dapis sp. BLCC M172 TaxID=2975281 RepID=UPI003CE6F688
MKKILFIFHKPTTNPGPVGKILKQRGYELDVRVLNEGYQLPSTMNEYEAAISFGGSMSANDSETLPFIRTELDWIPKFIESGKPFLGICLGAQLLAKALGAKVTRHSEARVEIGYHPIIPTLAGSKYFNSKLYFYHWNGEGFELPSNAVKLASGEMFENQAFRYGENAYGVQFHPEMSKMVLEEWAATTDSETEQKLKLPGAQSWEEQIDKHLQYAPVVENWLERFFSLWLNLETSSNLS